MAVQEWIIFFYETGPGDRIVENFIARQQPQAQGKILRAIDLLKQNGSMLRMPHAKQLDTNVSELRIRGKEEIRILYGFSRHTIYLVHAFKKQTQKTPRKKRDCIA